MARTVKCIKNGREITRVVERVDVWSAYKPVKLVPRLYPRERVEYPEPGKPPVIYNED